MLVYDLNGEELGVLLSVVNCPDYGWTVNIDNNGQLLSWDLDKVRFVKM